MHTTANGNSTGERKTAENGSVSGRDGKGRFSKGNRGGPGNPFTRQAARLRQAALDAVSDDDIRATIAALKEKARAGDVAAIKLLLSYTVGKPTEAINPDMLGQHELETIMNNHVPSPEKIQGMMQGMPVEALLIVLRTLLPMLFSGKVQLAADVLTPAPDNDDEDDDVTDDGQAAEGHNPMADSIPDWMYEMARKSTRAEPEADANHAKDRNEKQAEAGGSGMKALDDLQQQLQGMCSELMEQRAALGQTRNGATSGQGSTARSHDARSRLRMNGKTNHSGPDSNERQAGGGMTPEPGHRLETDLNGAIESDGA